MAKVKVEAEQIEYMSGYANAVLIGLKTYLAALSPTQRQAFNETLKRNGQRAKEYRIVFYSAQADLAEIDSRAYVEGFDCALDALLLD